MNALLILLGLGAALAALRQYCLHRQWPVPPKIPFDGTIYRIGETVIAVRRTGEPPESVKRRVLV